MTPKKQKANASLALSRHDELTIPADFVLPSPIVDSGKAAAFAYAEFMLAQIRNPNTRAAYDRALRLFFEWCESRSLPLQQIAPFNVGQYFDQHPGDVATKNQHLSALRRLFDNLVNRHAIPINPAATVRGTSHKVVEGTTPEITHEQAVTLLASIDATNVVGLRDYAIIATLSYTAARAGAVAKLQRRHFYNAGDQWMLHFDEKGGKSREIPVRHDLQLILLAYVAKAGLQEAQRKSPLFRTAVRKEKRLTSNDMTSHDVCRLVKRRLKQAGLPTNLTAHSFRVHTLTNLDEQGVPLEDIQRLAGHADPRTTKLYIRREQKITRNVVERITPVTRQVN